MLSPTWLLLRARRKVLEEAEPLLAPGLLPLPRLPGLPTPRGCCRHTELGPEPAQRRSQQPRALRSLPPPPRRSLLPSLPTEMERGEGLGLARSLAKLFFLGKGGVSPCKPMTQPHMDQPRPLRSRVPTNGLALCPPGGCGRAAVAGGPGPGAGAGREGHGPIPISSPLFPSLQSPAPSPPRLILGPISSLPPSPSLAPRAPGSLHPRGPWAPRSQGRELSQARNPGPLSPPTNGSWTGPPPPALSALAYTHPHAGSLLCSGDPPDHVELGAPPLRPTWIRVSRVPQPDYGESSSHPTLLIPSPQPEACLGSREGPSFRAPRHPLHLCRGVTPGPWPTSTFPG
ncbi:proline-rich protein 2-like [Antechinus flavipes]|uniref:proline-rich protein 2-like n=1 Tax=Antechinus flavipes TaxID=38775 RepID=UPI0022360E83|nr:proline-rich protein 2-like [Antechinus flavipes]